LLWGLACGASSTGPVGREQPYADEGGAGGEAGIRADGKAGEFAGGRRSDEAGAGSGSDAGGSAGVEATAGQAGTASAEVRGRVVDFQTRRPLARRSVRIGDAVAITDGSGAFALELPVAPFDIAVTDPDGSTISLFASVTASELLLPHTVSAASQPSDNVVDLRGNLSGEGEYPLADNELVALRFLAESAEGSLTLPSTFGPDFGPMRIAWDGDGSVTGTMVVVRTRVDQNGSTDFIAVGIHDIRLRNGEDLDLELELEPAEQGRLSGRAEVPANQSLSFVQHYYRVPFAFGSIPISLDETQVSSFDLIVPDLGMLGGSYCVGAGSSDPFFLTEQCGLKLGASDVVLTLELPPELLEPAASGTVDPDSEFSWKAFDDGIHRLSLVAHTPSSASPSVFLFTAAASARFSDFSRLAELFTTRTTYDCSVAGYGSFPDLDEALSERGLAARLPGEARAGISAPRTIVMSR
jgi:hypothetical protein